MVKADISCAQKITFRFQNAIETLKKKDPWPLAFNVDVLKSS